MEVPKERGKMMEDSGMGGGEVSEMVRKWINETFLPNYLPAKYVLA